MAVCVGSIEVIDVGGAVGWGRIVALVVVVVVAYGELKWKRQCAVGL